MIWIHINAPPPLASVPGCNIIVFWEFVTLHETHSAWFVHCAPHPLSSMQGLEDHENAQETGSNKPPEVDPLAGWRKLPVGSSRQATASSAMRMGSFLAEHAQAMGDAGGEVFPIKGLLHMATEPRQHIRGCHHLLC